MNSQVALRVCSRYLLNANVDWGQHLIRLNSWMQNHPEAKPMYCSASKIFDSRDIGMNTSRVHIISTHGGAVEEEYTPGSSGYAVSLSNLFVQHGGHRDVLKHVPVDRVGYSTWYNIIPARSSNHMTLDP